MTRLNQIGSWHRTPPEKCDSVPGRLLAGLRPRSWPRLGTRGSPDLRTRLVLLYEGEQLHHGGSAELGAGGIAVQGQKTGGSTRQAQHDAVAIADENVAIWIACRRDNLELSTIEGVGRIGHCDAAAGAIRVVEGGINIGYRSTTFRTRSSWRESLPKSPMATFSDWLND